MSKHSVVELSKAKFDRKASLKEQESQQRQLEFEADERKKKAKHGIRGKKSLP